MSSELNKYTVRPIKNPALTYPFGAFVIASALVALSAAILCSTGALALAVIAKVRSC